MTEFQNIASIFFNASKIYPEKAAIIDKKRTISFADLEKEVYQTANYLKKQKIKNGDRILVFVPMGIELYRILLAIITIGATAVFIDEWANKKRLDTCCKTVNCQAFIGSFKARILRFFSPSLRKIPICLSSSILDSNEKASICNIKNNDTAIITFTTGSTGIPKAANRTHEFLNEQYRAIIQKLNPDYNDIDLPTLPIVLLVNLAFGNTSVIANFSPSKPENLMPEKIVRQIIENKISRISCSPFFILAISRHLIKNNIELKSVKKIITGGAPIFPDDAKIITSAFPNSNIEIWYGSTEAEPISSIDGITLSNYIPYNGLCVGKIYEKIEVKIINIAKSNDIKVLENNNIGEIIVSGNHVLKEYIDKEETEKSKFHFKNKLWHKTGDAGFIDNNNTLYLVGRSSKLIKINNQYISPFIVEYKIKKLINNINSVIDINNKIVVFLEKTSALDIDSSIKNIKKTFPFVNEIVFLHKIPRDKRHFTKIDYDKLTELYKCKKYLSKTITAMDVIN